MLDEEPARQGLGHRPVRGLDWMRHSRPPSETDTHQATDTTLTAEYT